MNDLESKMQISFKNTELLARALVHKSFAHEVKGGSLENNEKLEFLGDAVLDLALGDYLMELFPGDSEGNLSKKRASLVNEEVLAKIAVELGLPQYLKLGKGETNTGGAHKPRLVASAYEALLGALFLDQGFNAARDFIRRDFTQVIQAQDPNQDYERDYKTRLQEVLQKDCKEAPQYQLLSEEGPPHERIFQVHVKIQDRILGTGRGRSKKLAEQAAAKEVLENFASVKPQEKKV